MIARVKVKRSGTVLYLPMLPSRARFHVLIRKLWLRFTAPRITRKKWKTLDGRQIRICDMSAGHLLNALHWARSYRSSLYWETKKVKGKWEHAHPLLEALLVETRRRRLPTVTKPEWLSKRNVEYRTKGLS